MLQQLSALLQPLTINTDEAGVEAMRQVGPGGHFFGCDHTQARFQTAFYEPFLSNWQNYENWTLGGGLDATAQATTIWPQILEEFAPPPIDPAIREELKSYVAKRKEELGTDEPMLEPVG